MRNAGVGRMAEGSGAKRRRRIRPADPRCRVLPHREGARAVSATGVRGGGGSDELATGGAGAQWGEDGMQTLKPLEPGAVFWPERDDLSVIRGLGVRCGQMVVHGTMDLPAAVATWKASLEETGFQLITV